MARSLRGAATDAFSLLTQGKNPSRRKTKRRIALALTVAVAVESASCGTLIHPIESDNRMPPVLHPSIIALNRVRRAALCRPRRGRVHRRLSTGADLLAGAPIQPVSAARSVPAARSLSPTRSSTRSPRAARRRRAYAPPLTWTDTGVTFCALSRPLRRINTDAAKLTKDRIAATVSAMGHRVQLDAPEVRDGGAPTTSRTQPPNSRTPTTRPPAKLPARGTYPRLLPCCPAFWR